MNEKELESHRYLMDIAALEFGGMRDRCRRAVKYFEESHLLGPLPTLELDIIADRCAMLSRYFDARYDDDGCGADVKRNEALASFSADILLDELRKRLL